MTDLKLEVETKLLAHACIALAESGKEVTSANLKAMVGQTDAQIQDFLLDTFAEAFSKIDYPTLKETTLSSGIGSSSASASSSSESKEEKEEEKAVEEEESEELDMGGMFD